MKQVQRLKMKTPIYLEICPKLDHVLTWNTCQDSICQTNHQLAQASKAICFHRERGVAYRKKVQDVLLAEHQPSQVNIRGWLFLGKHAFTI